MEAPQEVRRSLRSARSINQDGLIRMDEVLDERTDRQQRQHDSCPCRVSVPLSRKKNSYGGELKSRRREERFLKS